MNYLLFSNGKKVDDSYLLHKMAADEVGVFESMRTYHGKIFYEKEHLRRLEESVKTTGFRGKLNTASISRQLRHAVTQFHKEKGGGDVFVRLTLLGDSSYIMVGRRRHPDKLYRQGVKLKTTAVRRSLENAWPGEVKTTAYQNGVMAGLGKSPEEAYEWVLLDSRGYVSEVRVGNIFIIRQDNRKKTSLLTPPVTGILNGVTRLFVIECALRAGYEVRETPLMRHDLFNAREAFLTNTSWEILPVREVDARLIGDKVPGSVTLKLHSIFKERVQQQCQR